VGKLSDLNFKKSKFRNEDSNIELSKPFVEKNALIYRLVS
jgi:hypothetical protein